MNNLIPGELTRQALVYNAAVIVTDMPIAKRIRVHVVWFPKTGEQLEFQDMIDIPAEMLGRGYNMAIIAPGVKKRPMTYYWLTLTPCITQGQNRYLQDIADKIAEEAQRNASMQPG